jgi:ABC-type branched-subunit amino acid transport system ATPase component/ABC-type branched-subunit amino acid transport system permease subunit
MLGVEIFTANLLFLGLVRGLIVALVAMSLILVYRSSRVINFAVGDLGVPCAALLAITAGTRGWPYWISFVAIVFVGACAGSLSELIIRRLAHRPRITSLVATIGIGQLAILAAISLPEYRSGSLQGQYPTPFSGIDWHWGNVAINGQQLVVLLIAPAVMGVLWFVLGATNFGVAVRAAATNRDLARLTGINPKIVQPAVWALAGAVSAIAITLNATIDKSNQLQFLGPQTLARGLAAALIASMFSFPRALIGGILIGVIDQVLTFNYTSETGLVQFVLFIGVLVLVTRQSRSAEAGGEAFQQSTRFNEIPERLRGIWWARWIPRSVGVAFFAVAAIMPIVSDLSTRQQTWGAILAFAICGVSISILTGWAGQLSLSQMAFAGLGALTAATLDRGLEVDIGWGDTRILKGGLVPMEWPGTILIGAIAATGVAALVGLTALRVRGLLLAISTLTFAVAAQTYLYQRSFLTGGRTTVKIPRIDIGPFEFTHKNRAYFYFVLATLALVLLVVGRLRRSGVGRTIVAVRENENAAAAMTVSPLRAKLTAFATGGFIAGIGGGLLGGVGTTFNPSARYFRVGDSIQLVSAVVIGGLGSASGAVVGSLWMFGLPTLFPNNDEVGLLVSGIGLLLVVLYLPGGLNQVGLYVRDAIYRVIERRLPVEPTKVATSAPQAVTRARVGEVALNGDGSTLCTRGITVRFGGNVAVDGVSFRAMPGEVVGLIGTNGAGKSTLLNAIGGFVPSTGTVELLGRDISALAAHRRAGVGLGRTFQAATLFPELTVRDTVQIALEARHRTSFWGTLLFLPPTTRVARRRATDAADLIDFLGLGRYAERHIVELSTGTRRIVELAAVLAVAPSVICLDEPTAGIAQREAEAFGPLITSVGRELDATLVIVEHDMPMILSISDRVYCLEAGSIIAEGSPEAVRANPLVIASYLGTDDRAIARSDAKRAQE